MSFLGSLAIQTRQISTRNLNPKKFTSILANVPPKPASAWQIYQRENLQSFKRPDGKMDIIAAVKGLSSSWRSMSDVEKQRYQKQFEQESKAHEEAVKNAIANASPEQIRNENLLRKKYNLSSLKDPRKPKQPINAFMAFLLHVRASGDSELLSLPVKEQATRIAEKYRNLSESEKKPFLEQAAADKLRFAEEQKRYNANAA